jgi:hypothetical protein
MLHGLIEGAACALPRALLLPTVEVGGIASASLMLANARERPDQGQHVVGRQPDRSDVLFELRAVGVKGGSTLFAWQRCGCLVGGLVATACLKKSGCGIHGCSALDEATDLVASRESLRKCVGLVYR